jgi:hypothetical protein
VAQFRLGGRAKEMLHWGNCIVSSVLPSFIDSTGPTL